MESKDQYVYKKIQDYRTSCCKKSYYRKGRGDLRCIECNSDVTLEIVWLADLLEREYDAKNKSKNNPPKKNNL